MVLLQYTTFFYTEARCPVVRWNVGEDKTQLSARENTSFPAEPADQTDYTHALPV